MCGAVRFEVGEPLLGAVYCHCHRCQQRTGTAFSVSGTLAPGSLRVVEGEEHIRSWRPPDGGWVKSFCGICGSQLYAADPEAPERRGVRLGPFDADPEVRPSAHQFVAYAAAWHPLPDDGLPRHPERRPRVVG